MQFSNKPSDIEPPVRQAEQAQANTVLESQTGSVAAKKRSVALPIMTALFLLALGLAGALGYLWYESSRSLAAAENTAKAQSAENAKLQNQAAINRSSIESDEKAPKGTRDMTIVYNRILEQRVNTTPADETAINDALKKYYKVTTLPAGSDVLAVYQMVKPETPPSGDLHALVYWPASAEKPAGFIDMVKTKGAKEWQYQPEGL